MEELRGDVAGGSTAKVELLSWVLDDGRQAEVGYLQVPVVVLGGEEEVLRLEVAVNNPVMVKICEGREEVAHDRSCVRLPIQALALDLLEELATLKVRQQQVDILGRFISLIERDHTGMIDASQDVYLSQY